MNASEFASLRIFNLGLTHPRWATPGEVVENLIAVQSQDYPGAKWCVGRRMASEASGAGATDAILDQAFAGGAILRTHLLRPTWHFVTPADIGWLLDLTGPQVQAGNAGMYRQASLDEATLRRCDECLARAIQERGQPLTREELRDELLRDGLAPTENLGLIYILMHAELNGLICSGPRCEKQFTYALLEERAPSTRRLPRDEALAELARRFFTTRGPATLRDLAKWSGLRLADVRTGLEAVRQDLESLEVDGQVYWFLPRGAAAPAPPQALLLSVYDELISSYKDRSAVSRPEYGQRLASMGNALTHLLILDGQVEGTWRRVFEKKAVILEMDPFISLTQGQRAAVEEEARRYGSFLGVDAVVR